MSAPNHYYPLRQGGRDSVAGPCYQTSIKDFEDSSTMKIP